MVKLHVQHTPTLFIVCFKGQRSWSITMDVISYCIDRYCLIGLALLLVYLGYKVFKFATADADLYLLGHSLKPEFFKGKVVWVTGTSSGIGEELCKQLSKCGAKVILSARSEGKLMKVASSLSDGKVLVLDLADPESVASATEKAVKLFGRIDILINNAGVWCKSSFLDFQEKCSRELMEINFFGTVSLTRDVVKVMIKQGGGHIVNVSSLLGKFGANSVHYYSASKFALIGLMDSLRYELADKNITITNICPGPVKTNLSINALSTDGTKFGKTDPILEGGVSVDRCAKLTLLAVCNGIRESWIAKQPVLAIAYFAQYFPSLSHYVLKNNRVDTAI